MPASEARSRAEFVWHDHEQTSSPPYAAFGDVQVRAVQRRAVEGEAAILPLADW
jgi:hypothetical protein